MKKTKLERLMSIIPISLAFVIVGVFVLMLMDILPKNRFMIDVLLILGIFCFGCISCMPATKMLSKNKRNVYAYIILGLTALTCLLWIVFVFVGQGFIDSIAADSTDFSTLVGVWNYLKVVIFITIQTSIFNLVISNIFTFKREYLAFQIVMYVSNAIVDLWLTIAILSLYVTSDGLAFGADWLVNSKFVLTLFILALAFSSLASSIMRSIIKKRTRDLTIDTHANQTDIAPKVQEQPSLEDRIKKLDDLKEKGMITEEEYNQKRAKILEEI